MSVPKSKRNLSDLEFYSNAMMLYKEINIIFINNFNTIKNHKYNRSFIVTDYNVYTPNKELNKIIREYNNDIHLAIINLQDWILIRKRDIILKLLDQLINYIVYANSIYPTCKKEYEEKRLYQTKAICTCRAILTHFQLITEIFHEIKIDKYKRYIDMLSYEIKLLKDWRTKSNKYYNKK